MEELGHKNNVRFLRYATFQDSFLLPVAHYVTWKLRHGWDDYNELYHCHHFLAQVQSDDHAWIHYHIARTDNDIVGILFIVGDDSRQVTLKYLHIIDKGNGYGSHWLRDIIIPYYKSQQFASIAVSSSHPQSFPFYERFGKEVQSYTRDSDNGFFKRQGKSFQIDL